MNVLLVTSEGACGIAEGEVGRLERDIVERASGCWEWVGPVAPHTGYGTYYSLACRLFRVHRLVYALTKGTPGPAIDHLCRNKICVNPDHLESVSVRTNTLRGIGPSARNAAKTHCKRGHLLDAENCRTKRGPHGPLRTCRSCARIQARHRWELFKRLHSAKDREKHWQSRKTNCAECVGFLQTLKTEEVRNARLTCNL
jgi:hypothetical protein